MKLSIITPVYNGANFLSALVNAILQQQLSDFELILVDDGSTDDSFLLCDKYAMEDSRIKVIHKENGGVSSARNAGLEVASGEWIGFVDCDDCPKPEMYEKLLFAAEQDNCDLVMGGYEKISETETTPVSLNIGRLLQGEQVKKIVYSMAFWNGYLKGESLTTIYGSVWPNIYKTEIIRKNNLSFNEKISLGEDLLFNLAYLRYVNKVAVVDEPLYKYNISNQSATRKRNTMLWNHYARLAEEVEKILIEMYEVDDELKYNLQRQYINYAINVAEEQICVFLKGKKMRRALKELCNEEVLQEASSYVEKYGMSKKEKLQAKLIHGKQTHLFGMWLNKR